MKKIIALIVLALLGFYVAWPAWSGYRIFTALQTRDAALLESKVDFGSIRTGLRPTVEAQVGRELDNQLKQAGPLAGALGGDVKKQLTGQLVDTVLNTVVTPANVIRIAAEGGDVAATVRKIIGEEMGKKMGGLPGLGGLPGSAGGGLPGGIGGLGGLAGAGAALGLPGLPGLGGGSQAPAQPTAPPPAASAPATTTKPSYGLSNIKSFGFDGLTGYKLAVGRDPASPKPDVTAGLRFTGFDWKLTSIVPNL